MHISDVLCQQNRECDFWTWKGLEWSDANSFGTQCWLKTSDEGQNQQNGVYSGSKSCSWTKND